MSIYRRAISAFLRRAKGPEAAARQEWHRLLGDGAIVGQDSHIRSARLVVREHGSGGVQIGSESNIEATIVLERSEARVHIGSRTHIGGGTSLSTAEFITIGDDVLIAFEVLVMDHDSHALEFAKRAGDVRAWLRGQKDWSDVRRSRVEIQNKSWVGARALILKGVTVGEGAVVAAGSVVVRDVDPWTIVAGNPAKPVRSLVP